MCLLCWLWADSFPTRFWLGWAESFPTRFWLGWADSFPTRFSLGWADSFLARLSLYKTLSTSQQGQSGCRPQAWQTSVWRQNLDSMKLIMIWDFNDMKHDDWYGEYCNKNLEKKLYFSLGNIWWSEYEKRHTGVRSGIKTLTCFKSENGQYELLLPS